MGDGTKDLTSLYGGTHPVGGERKREETGIELTWQEQNDYWSSYMSSGGFLRNHFSQSIQIFDSKPLTRKMIESNKGQKIGRAHV